MEAFTRRIEADEDGDLTPMDESGGDPPSSISKTEVETDDLKADAGQTSRDMDVCSSSESAGIDTCTLASERLPLFGGPEFIRRLNVFEEVDFGGCVVFECQCKALPTPVTKWFKDDVELVETDRIRIEDTMEMDGTLRLVITNVKKSDEGAYRCKLENQEGVAATTGYLSVTGVVVSPKSDHAVSAPPLLRAITEESYASNSSSRDDNDEETVRARRGRSSSLEKILTSAANYDDMPYSEYMDLLKKSGMLSPTRADDDSATTSGINQNETNGGNRTPTDDAYIGDVMNISTEIGDAAQFPVAAKHDVISSVYAEEKEIPVVEKEMEVEGSDQTMFQNVLATHSTSNWKTASAADESAAGAAYDQTVFGDVEGNLQESGVEGESRSEIADENDVKSVVEKEANPERCEVDVNCISDGDTPMQNDLVTVDENKLKETVIVGRIGIPSDWEFTHYSPELEDDVEDDHAVLGSVGQSKDARTAAEECTNASAEGEIKQDSGELEVVLSDSDIPTSPATSGDGESTVGVESHDSLLDGASMLRDVLRGNTELPEDAANQKRPADVIEPGAAAAAANVDQVSPENQASPSGNDETNCPVAQNGILKTGSTQPFSSFPVAVSQTEAEPETSCAASKSDSEQDSGVSIQLNWTANSEVPEVIEAEVLPKPTGPEEDERKQSNEAAGGFSFTSFVSDLSPKVAAIAEWIPEVPSISISDYLPDVSCEAKPAEVEEVDVQIVAEVHEDGIELLGLDWWMEWFRCPWVFYVLVVLLMTLSASATEMSPSLVILIVSFCSIVGFWLFPFEAVVKK